MEKAKAKKIWKIIGNVAFYGVIGLITLFAVLSGIDQHTGYSLPIFGLRSSVVITPSMENKNPVNTYLTDDMEQIERNAIITTKMVSYEEIEIYDVITYTTNGESLICHRVVDKYETENGYFIVTRGDANNTDDTPINFTAFRGKVINVIHGGGQVILFIQSPYFLIAVFASIFFVSLGFFIPGVVKEQKEKKAINVIVDKEEATTKTKEESETKENEVKK